MSDILSEGEQRAVSLAFFFAEIGLAEHTGGDGPFHLFEETRGWEFPYCSQCLEHVQLQANTGQPGLGPLAAGPLLGVPW